jgi:hypothetical protein
MRIGDYNADVLRRPFPGRITHIRQERRCSPRFCVVRLAFAIRNPTHRDGNVEACHLIGRPSVQFQGVGPRPGLPIPAGTSARGSGRYVIGMPTGVLGHAHVLCAAVDWHGDEPP